jgi:hypothetical protein
VSDLGNTNAAPAIILRWAAFPVWNVPGSRHVERLSVAISGQGARPAGVVVVGISSGSFRRSHNRPRAGALSLYV